MDGADILGIIALAFGGGTGAYVIWYIIRFGAGDGPQPPHSPDQPPADGPGWGRDKRGASDPAILAEIAALRSEIASIAATQARMLQGQTDHESMLLGEMRAIASAMDPKIVESLARIESTVGTAGARVPKPEPAGAPDVGSGDDAEAASGGTYEIGIGDAGSPDTANDPDGGDDDPDDTVEDRSDGGGRSSSDGEKLYVVPDAREDKPDKPARTIRRG